MYLNKKRVWPAAGAYEKLRCLTTMAWMTYLSLNHTPTDNTHRSSMLRSSTILVIHCLIMIFDVERRGGMRKR